MSSRRIRRGLVYAAVAALVLAVVPGQVAAAAPADGTVRTFETEPVGAPPADCDIIGDVTIADAGFGGAPTTNKAMRLVDQSNTVYTRTWCHYPQTAERSVTYRFSPTQFNAGPYVAIQGAPGTSANGVWRFTFNRDGNDIRVAAYNGSSFADVARITGGAALNQWVDVTINATLDRAELILNGVRFETDRRNASSPTLGDIYFGSAGASAVGVHYYIDDLAVSGELADDAFAGIPVEPLFEGAVARGEQIVDAPLVRFQLPEGASVADYTVVADWRGETIPTTLSEPDADGWVTASITHTFTQAGAGTLRTTVTDAEGITSVSTQEISVAGDLSTLTFESDPVGALPPDCSTLGGYTAAGVSDEAAHEGARSLRLHDTSTTASVGVTCTNLGQQGVYLSFQLNPLSLQGFTFDVIGRSLQPTGQPANSLFRFAARADGGILWYETATSSYRELAPAGTLPGGQWSRVTVAVPTDHAAARVSVDGVYVGSAGSTIGNNAARYNEVAAITGIAFTTSGSGAAGNLDDVFVDDVVFGTPDLTPQSEVGTSPFRIGDEVVVDNEGLVGFPNPGAVVPHGNGSRLLLSYSEHPDTTSASGSGLAMSDDGGATWTKTLETNPMPHTSGFQLTQLRNGDVIAVNHHTYMTADTHKATVETAVSHDNGATWTQRAGLMTAPEPMRPLAASERPGTTLGGFLALHTLLEDPDGTLYMSAYGFYAVDTKYRQIVLVSEDGGVNWSVRGTVGVFDASIPDTSGPCEGALERLADGSLLMVMRMGPKVPMMMSRSFDNGATWTPLEKVKVGPSQQDLYAIQPTLELLPTGELLLMVGRPGLVLTVSRTGLGNDWTVPVGVDYANSENGAFNVLDPFTLAVTGDRGRVLPARVWSRHVTIEPPCETVVTGAHDGPLNAGTGGLCLVDATVTGAITVTDGGRLITQNSTITGPVHATDASTVSLCASTITGPVTVTGTTGTVAIGDTTSGCRSTTIAGPVRITGSGGSVVVDRAKITGAVSLTDNHSALASVLAGVDLRGPLACSGNAVAPTDAGAAATVVGPRTGQCADLSRG
ncbi:exo-alpha-sialidase [Microbacterium sp. NEAU-LLC]|uniref:Exo-alpha-sialidase n=1 Tax=Microbacterium helvum TaxID=2773713 RepID=A0ABR8NPX2_9MICO|nr:sialidase family protein [Microbacterium helvum]MBD3942676.1 exo-alpha-sialidase [Microbacterium helvum]